MKNKQSNTFVTRLARGAVASTLAACVVPEAFTEPAVIPALPGEVTLRNQGEGALLHEAEQTDRPSVSVVLDERADWDKRLEKEFRSLALTEAQGTLNSEQAKRLEELSRLRDRLLSPQDFTDIILQVKRDRLLARMESLLREYVDFQEATDKTRAAA